MTSTDEFVKYDATGRMIRSWDPPVPPRKPRQLGPIETEKTDEFSKLRNAEKEIQKSLEIFKKGNLKTSARFLRHYIEGSGRAVKITPEEIDSSVALREGIEVNNQRFVDSLSKGYVDGDQKKISSFRDQILRLREGQSITLDNPSVKDAGDAWDRDIKRTQSWRSDADRRYSLGAVKLRSLGNLRATRRGNAVHIDGEIYHTIKDKYDFNSDTIYDRNFFKNERFLAEQGKARPFSVYGHKAQKITGRLDIQHGTIRSRTFKWTDLDE